jgi:hypothetical protein
MLKLIRPRVDAKDALRRNAEAHQASLAERPAVRRQKKVYPPTRPLVRTPGMQRMIDRFLTPEGKERKVA